MKKIKFFVVLLMAMTALAFSACDTASSSDQTETSEEVFEATDAQYAEFKPYLQLVFDSAGCFWYVNNTDTSSSSETITTTLSDDDSGTFRVTKWCTDGSTASWNIAADGTVTSSDTTTTSDSSSYPTSAMTKNEDGTYTVKTMYSESNTTEGTITITTSNDGSYTVKTSYSDGSVTTETTLSDSYTSEKTDSHGCSYANSGTSTSEEITIEFKGHEFTYEASNGDSYAASSINGKVYETTKEQSDTDTYAAASLSVEMICDGKEISIAYDLEAIASYDSTTDTSNISSSSGSAIIKIDGMSYSLTEAQILAVLMS